MKMEEINSELIKEELYLIREFVQQIISVFENLSKEIKIIDFEGKSEFIEKIIQPFCNHTIEMIQCIRELYQQKQNSEERIEFMKRIKRMTFIYKSLNEFQCN